MCEMTLRCIVCLSPSVPGDRAMEQMSNSHEDGTRHYLHKQYKHNHIGAPVDLTRLSLYVPVFELITPCVILKQILNQTGMNIKTTNTKASKMVDSLTQPLKTGPQSYIHLWAHKILQGPKVLTAQKTLCRSMSSANTRSSEWKHTVKQMRTEAKIHNQWKKPLSHFPFDWYNVDLTIPLKPKLIHPYCWMNSLSCFMGTHLLQVQAVQTSGLFMA